MRGGGTTVGDGLATSGNRSFSPLITPIRPNTNRMKRNPGQFTDESILIGYTVSRMLMLVLQVLMCLFVCATVAAIGAAGQESFTHGVECTITELKRSV